MVQRFDDERLHIDFPSPWSYRCIGRDELAMRAAIATVLGGRRYSVEQGNISNGGRYRSVHVEVVVENDRVRRSIFWELAAHDDIRYVL